MVKVITYGTFDLFHAGHQRLLDRAKNLGDYLIVGVTTEDFDKKRGKINVQQSLSERIESVRKTGLADLIIVEEYEGQKIDDILKYEVDIFAIGSDWMGKFDYLNQYCNVIYLERTRGISSTKLRSESQIIRIGIVGNSSVIPKFINESKYVNGIQISGVYSSSTPIYNFGSCLIYNSFEKLVSDSDAIYLVSPPRFHYAQCKYIISQGKHVICESPISTDGIQIKELFDLARNRQVSIMDFIKTAHSTAYVRMILLIKSGKIGRVVSINATCTSLRDYSKELLRGNDLWNSICSWGPTALLPVFQILGTEYSECIVSTALQDNENKYDLFTKIDLWYKSAVASILVGKGIRSEGELIISGTKGHIYVPAPWWKTDYFECRFENQNDNQKYYYQLDGEGIRLALATFAKSIRSKAYTYGDNSLSIAIGNVINNFYNRPLKKLSWGENKNDYNTN